MSKFRDKKLLMLKINSLLKKVPKSNQEHLAKVMFYVLHLASRPDFKSIFPIEVSNE